MLVAGNDPRLRWAGAPFVQQGVDWSRPWRFAPGRHALFPSPHDPGRLWRRADQATGVRLVVRTDSTTVRLVVDAEDADARPFDLCIGADVVTSAHPDDDGSVTFTGLPPGMRDLEIWLPQFGTLTLNGVHLADGAVVQVPRRLDSCRRWTVYGSSITQCRTALSPTRTWPSIVARSSNSNLTCFGLAGAALLEQVVARAIRDVPADVITAEIGINIYGSGAFNIASLRNAVIGFLLTIRDGHPSTRLTVVSPIASPVRESCPGLSGLTLAQVRTEIRDAVAALNDTGADIDYLDGRELLGPRDAHLLADGLHPSNAGYRLMAERVLALGLS